VLVTGGNRGLGLAISKEFLRQGANVIITSRTPASIEGIQVIDGIEVQNYDCSKKLVNDLKENK